MSLNPLHDDSLGLLKGAFGRCSNIIARTFIDVRITLGAQSLP